MAKRNKPCPGWLATFADLMSLLMAVFVLLFAMSTLDASKYEAVVKSLTEALGHGRDMTQTQVQYFKSQKSTEVDGETTLQDLKPLYDSLIQTYSIDQKDSNDIKIDYDPLKNQIKVSFSEEISFPSGQATLKPKLIFQLRKLKVYINPDLLVKAVGHTDERPITGGRYESNWELSSARAAAVINQLVEDKVIAPNQGEAIGLAETMPISKENTMEAYAKNRRVEVLLMPLSARL